MNVQSLPIGVFDSGLGGMSVVRELRALLPAEEIVYYADSAHCPYGHRAVPAIAARSSAIAAALIDRGVKLLVVACNTATSVALPTLRTRFPGLPIIGMVPAVKPAAAATRSGRIAVLATPRTLAGDVVPALVRDHASGAEVVLVPAPGLVELVEHGELDGPRVEAALRPLLRPLAAHGIDTLVLGCTHYPFLREATRRIVEPELTIIDSGCAVARRARDLLDADGRRSRRCSQGSLTLWTSGEANSVGTVASRLLGTPVTATRLIV